MSAVSASVRQPASVPFQLANPVTAINIALIVLAALGLAYYVAGANGVAAQQYHILSLHNQVSQLTQAQSTLTAEKSATEDPTAAAAFAQAQNMVVAKDIVYVFENNNVALQK